MQLEDRMEIIELVLSKRPNAYADEDGIRHVAELLDVAHRRQEIQVRVDIHFSVFQILCESLLDLNFLDLMRCFP